MKDIKEKELLEIKKEYAEERKTEIKDEITEIKIDQEALIPKEDVIVSVTSEGYVKRTSKRSFSSSNDEDITLKDNDYILGLYELNTLDTILMFTDIGNYSLEYNMHGFTNHTSPNDLYTQLKDGIGACNCHAENINVINTILLASII